VIASYVLREAMANVKNFTAEEMATLVDSRVSEEKREKVFDQVEKITLKFRQRLEGTISKFDGTAKPKKDKRLDDARVEKAKEKLGKKKKKKNRD
jgi:predicted secreted protein